MISLMKKVKGSGEREKTTVNEDLRDQVENKWMNVAVLSADGK